MSYNQISVTGIVANIPELKFAASGTAFLALSVPDKKLSLIHISEPTRPY